MKVEIKANILKDLENICITIDAPELTEEVQNIINYISNINKKLSQIIADKDEQVSAAIIDKLNQLEESVVSISSNKAFIFCNGYFKCFSIIYKRKPCNFR